MADGLDHIVHAVRDLDAAADLYQRAGFTVGVRNVHPWGTHNRIIQVGDFFVELLTVAEPMRIVERAPRLFSFGAFHRDYLTRREGLSMLLLQSRDPQRDAARFKAHGLGDFETFNFSRTGTDAAGAAVTLAFTLAFAEDAMSPAAGLAVCQHHHPEHFWNPAAQRHGNGVRRLLGVVMVAAAPSAHRDALQDWTGHAALASAGDVAVQSANGAIEIITPAAFAARYQVTLEAGEGARFAALRFAVDDLGDTAARLAAAGLRALRAHDALVLPPDAAFGAALVFEAPGDTAASSMA